MLYFTSDNGIREWHIGEKKPQLEKIIEVQADGSELEFIKDNFRNLPYVLFKKVQIWREEMAEYIYLNL